MGRQTTASDISLKLCGDPERLLNKACLPHHIALCQPPHLSLAEHVHRLVAFNGSQRAIDGSEPLHGSSHWPIWSPDGKRLTYRVWGPAGAPAGATHGFTMWWMPADRSGAPERVTNLGIMQSPSSWSPDGRVLAFTQSSPETGSDVYTVVVDDPQRKPVPFAQTKFAEGSPKFSPDGRWIAYTSNETGRNEIYVQSYPGPGPKIQVSKDGGMDAVWRPNGGELYYRDGDKMMAVSVSTRQAFTASLPRMLWSGRYTQGTSSACGPPGTNSSNYDVSPDGQHFLMIKDSDTESFPSQINVVLNWTEELKRIMAEKGRP